MPCIASTVFSVSSENTVIPALSDTRRMASISSDARPYTPVHIRVSAASKPVDILRFGSGTPRAAASARSIHCPMSPRCGWRRVSETNMLQATRASSSGEPSGVWLAASSSTAIQRSSSEKSSSS